MGTVRGFEGIGPDLVEGVRRIKAKDGKDLIVSGSSTLISALLEHGLSLHLFLFYSLSGKHH
jgi:dihydrofolate reductase